MKDILDQGLDIKDIKPEFNIIVIYILVVFAFLQAVALLNTLSMFFIYMDFLSALETIFTLPLNLLNLLEALIYIFCLYLIYKQRKKGFKGVVICFIYKIAATMYTFILINFIDLTFALQLLILIIQLLVLRAILQIKNSDGISAWSLLK